MSAKDLELAKLPQALRTRPQWLLWRLEPGATPEAKQRKMPYYAAGRRRTGTQGSPADRAALVDFDTAVAALHASRRWAGIGFAFLPDDGLIGIDIDNAIDGDGVVSDLCRQVIELCPSYTERSVSGKGVHIIVEGQTQTFKDDGLGLEVYCGAQYFTCTGAWWPGAPAEVRPIDPDVLAYLRELVDERKRGRAKATSDAQPKDAARGVSVSPAAGKDDFARTNDAALRQLGAWVPDLFPKARPAASTGGYRITSKALGRSLQEDLSITPEGIQDFGEERGYTPIDLVMRWSPHNTPKAALHWLAERCGVKLDQRPKKPRTPPPEGGDGRPEPPFPAKRERNRSEPPKAEEWPDPILPGTLQTPEIPADILPTWLADMAGAVAESTQTPPALAVMSCLAVLGTVLQRRFEVAPFGDDYTESLSLWTMSGAPSGGRKTAVLSAMIRPLLHWEKLKYDQLRQEIAKSTATRAIAVKRIDRLQGEAAKAKDEAERQNILAEIEREHDNMPPEVRAPRLFTTSITAEQAEALLVEQRERVAVHSDEPGILAVMAGLYSRGVANIDVYLQGHAGSAMRVDRAGRTAHVDKPAISFGLMVQPGVLAELAGSNRFRHSGLLARFLFAMPVSNVGTRDVRKHVKIPPEVSRAYEEGIFALLEGATKPVAAPRVLALSEWARERWLDLAQEIEHQQGDGGRYEAIADWTSKLPGATARIAALLELAASGLQVEQVSPSTMDRAVRLARLLIPHAQVAFGLLGADAVDTDAEAVLKWVQAGQLVEFKRSTCQKAMEGRFRSVERLLKALTRLVHHDVLRESTRPNPGARPSAIYRVNPKASST